MESSPCAFSGRSSKSLPRNSLFSIPSLDTFSRIWRPDDPNPSKETSPTLSLESSSSPNELKNRLLLSTLSQGLVAWTSSTRPHWSLQGLHPGNITAICRLPRMVSTTETVSNPLKMQRRRTSIIALLRQGSYVPSVPQRIGMDVNSLYCGYHRVGRCQTRLRVRHSNRNWMDGSAIEYKRERGRLSRHGTQTRRGGILSGKERQGMLEFTVQKGK